MIEGGGHSELEEEQQSLEPAQLTGECVLQSIECTV
jgi:hypothetical protein